MARRSHLHFLAQRSLGTLILTMSQDHFYASATLFCNQSGRLRCKWPPNITARSTDRLRWPYLISTSVGKSVMYRKVAAFAATDLQSCDLLLTENVGNRCSRPEGIGDRDFWPAMFCTEGVVRLCVYFA
jgi:hypothetical protein